MRPPARVPSAGRPPEGEFVRVLIVSEDARERLRAGSALSLHQGAEVVEVPTGGEARALVASEPFDVLVVDGDLSPQGGFSLLYELREAGEFRGEAVPPAVVLTAREQDRFLSDWSGAARIVAKPVDPFALSRAVGELVGAPAPTVAVAADEAEA
jgi:DNA-binding response OmpR family regulator